MSNEQTKMRIGFPVEYPLLWQVTRLPELTHSRHRQTLATQYEQSLEMKQIYFQNYFE